MLTITNDFRNLLSNPFNCNCHLGWLAEWLRKKNLVTGNPRCLAPSYLKDMPIQDLKPTDFKCESKTYCVLIIRKIHSRYK